MLPSVVFIPRQAVAVQPINEAEFQKRLAGALQTLRSDAKLGRREGAAVERYYPQATPG
jgi:hypothetical protein